MMDIDNLIVAIKLCGSTPKVDQCTQCIYWAGGDMSKCIPRMTTEAATALSTLLDENERLRAELAQADREERCVVLPCKVGDTIYRVVHCDNGSGDAVWTIRVNFVEFNDNDIVFELPNHVIGTTENGAGTTMEFSDFGKTVFLTREEAEAALEGKKNG